MLARQHRFHGRNSLSLVYRRGSTARNQHMSLKYMHNQRRTTYRVAVIVSRKVHKSAVSRNRIRRRIYEIIRTNDASILEPYDIVLTIFSDQVIDMTPARLTRTILELLTKTNIVKAVDRRPSSPPHAIVKTNEDNL